MMGSAVKNSTISKFLVFEFIKISQEYIKYSLS